MRRRSFSEFEFAYWLQGAFEIGAFNDSSAEALSLIHHRLNDVKNPGRLCFTARLMLWHCKAEEAIPALSKLLQEIFIHDIDPSYDGDQAILHLVHTGEKEHA